MSKYKNKKLLTEHGVFDSKAEYGRFLELMALQERGEISDLQRQVDFTLIPNQYINNKLIERAVKYKADFVYKYKGEKVVEDVKSNYTKSLPDYKIKRKMLLYFYGIRLNEVVR